MVKNKKGLSGGAERLRGIIDANPLNLIWVIPAEGAVYLVYYGHSFCCGVPVLSLLPPFAERDVTT